MTNTYDTSDLPLGTTSPKALYNNASNMDEGMNSESPAFFDRFGKRRQTWAGMESAFSTLLLNSGYETPVPYTAGLVITRQTQTVTYMGDIYRVVSTALPLTTTDWATDSPNMRLVSDSALRADLAAPTGAELIGFGTGTVADALAGLGAGLQVVDSVSAMRALLKTGATTALTRSYYGDNAGGSAFYRLDPLDTTTGDNGGSVIVATDGGRWKMIVDEASGVDVRQFGAKGDTVHDDTPCIQNALDTSLFVRIGPGMLCKLTAPLLYRPNHQLEGVCPELSQLWRNTAYGDTLTPKDPLTNSGAVTVKGIWFNHNYVFADGAGNQSGTYTPGTTVRCVNRDPTSAHLKILRGQNVNIERCWFYGLGYQIYFLDTAVMWVTKCLFNGIYDYAIDDLRDTTAGIFGAVSSPSARNGLIYVTGCHIAGYSSSAPVNVTTGDVTVSKAFNCGIKWGIYFASAERFSIIDNYIGGQSEQSIRLQSTGILAHGVISGNMLDAAREYSIMIDSTNNTTFPNLISITDNTAVGYGIDKGFVRVFDSGTARSAAYIRITDNICQMYYRAAIRLEKVTGCRVVNNDIISYNSDISTVSDPYAQAGCVVDANCTYVRTYGNMYGGSTNAPGGANGAKWGAFYYATPTNRASNEDTYGLGIGGGTVVGGLTQTYPT